MLRYSTQTQSPRFGDTSTPTMKRVQLVDRLGSDSNINGTIHVTTSHVVFRADEGVKEIWIANALINTVERTPVPNVGTRLTVKCKNFQVLTLLVTKDKDCTDLFDALSTCGRLYNINDAFAFVHKDGEAKNADGWARLDWKKEFERQELNEMWKLSDFNKDYAYCDTYPEKLWFPARATRQILIGSCKFRSRSRLPSLTYFHKQTGASICRCSQPLSGFSARCVEDESLMESIRCANPTSQSLFIIDTRPRINAMANKMQGKGFEDMRNYTNMQFHSFDIENIHVMRNSQTKLLEACQKQMPLTDFLKAVDLSNWLKHLKALFDCGKFIADAVVQGTSCVVHCSDGWDRTAQTVSIAQLLLDSYYRTFHGFQVLIDKDWLGFGFKIDDRCAHITSPNDEYLKEISPIFTQFIDVVYQIMRQEPLAFEFNERFLFDLNEHAYSCLYGTFVGNCDKDRKDLRASTRTQSFWRVADSRLASYTNPFYDPDSFKLSEVDMPHSAFVVWSSMYNRFDTGIQTREYFSDIPLSLKEHVDLMETALKESEFSTTNKVAVQWQSLLGCEECSSTNCQREFVSRYEHRLHCHSCGLVYCQRCINVKEDRRLCVNSPCADFPRFSVHEFAIAIMLNCGRLLIRVGAPHALAKELNNTIRGTSIKTLCAVATSPASTNESPTQTKNVAQKVDATCCGFAKDLIGAPSTVLDHGIFGEDACFISRYKSIYVAGVADGVGGWRKYGVDPSQFSSHLMNHCSDIVRSGDFQPNRPDLIIANAFDKLSVSPRPIGSSTACVVVIHQRTLYAANLGDSGYLVYRNGKIIQRSAEQVHYFNAPFQLTLLPEQWDFEGFIRDTPEKSDLQRLEMESGDVVLLATDGLWDNVPDAVIIDALNGVEASNLQSKCNTIALIARRLSHDLQHASPFAVKAGEHGYRTSGGKPDDISVVLMFIT
ncbi:Myotubularin-related and Zinc finger domain containing protein [Aphelenchoides besseyi]|nr:Myotubularin-related and Zinc finger domain containing protein [Aphelenchoides besseyi]